MAKTSIQTKELQTSIANIQSSNIVGLSYRTATSTTGTPATGTFHSTVSNRSRVVDLTNDLMPRMGVERIQIQQLMRVADEQGATGEPVYKPVNDKFDQIRAVGAWSADNAQAGSRIYPNLTSDYVEVVFYGTGLNLLIQHTTNANYLTYSLNGGSETVVLNGVTYGNPLNTRGYAQNTVINVVAGLTLGLYTIKFRQQTGPSNYTFLGIEILNESSQVKTSPGTSITSGKPLTLSSLSSSTYNSSFESGSLGTRGGRVLVYQKSDGTIAKSVTPTNASQSNLSAADHSNEEVIRTYNWREFTAGRFAASDDFGTSVAASSAARAFVLDDGVTNLLTDLGEASSNTGTNDSLRLAGSNRYFVFTFVGTGLDIIADQDTGAFSSSSILIDGASIGDHNTFSADATTGIFRTYKLVSGLPYGTHTLRYTRPASGNFLRPLSFIVYGPKKPSLPSGAIELADYNVMANFVANTTAGQDTVGTGVLRRNPLRELLYINAASTTWATPGLDTANYASGFEITNSGAGSGASYEYVFFGTGFDFRARANTTFSAATSMQLQALTTAGSLLTISTTNFTISHNGGGASGTGQAITTTTYGGLTFTPAGGNLSHNASNAVGSGFTLTGLPLGLYRFKFTNGTNITARIDVFDVITPIHVNKNNGPYTQMNTLSVGNSGINDLRKFGTQLAERAKTSQWTLISSLSINTSSTTFVPFPGMVATIYLEKDSTVMLTGKIQGVHGGSVCFVFMRMLVNGMNIGATVREQVIVAGAYSCPSLSQNYIVTLPKGYHTVCGFWSCPSGVGLTNATQSQNEEQAGLIISVIDKVLN